MIHHPLQLARIESAARHALDDPAFLTVMAIAAVVTLLLYAEHPRVSRPTVVALMGWVVTATVLSAVAAIGDYPAALRPVVAGLGAYLTAAAIAGGVWFGLLQFARGSSGPTRLPTYLFAMGAGATVVLLAALFLLGGPVAVGDLIWLAIGPVAAAATAAVVIILLGLRYPGVAAYTGVVGGLVIFGQVLAGIATAVAVATGAGRHTRLSWAVLDLIASTDVAQVIGFDQQYVWGTGLIVTRLALALGAVLLLTPYTHRHPDRGNLLLGLVAATGIGGGLSTLLAMVVGA